jgi:hypothetical protein
MLSLIREWEWIRQCERWLSKPLPVIEVEVDRHAGEEVAKCKDCHRLLQARYHMRLIIHLRHDHKLSEDAATETTTWVMDRVYRNRMEHVRLAREMGKL